MIKISQQITADAIPDLEVFIDSMAKIVAELAEDSVQKYADSARRELSDYPPAAKHPIQWTSVKQRKAYFATDGFGAGIPYKRTNGLANAWVIESRTKDRTSIIVIENTAPQAKFVIGTLSNSKTSFQQQFHKNTGWNPVSETARYWLDAMMEDFTVGFNARIGEFANTTTKRRAFTS